ncbi:MAG: vitamin B12 dependent-methionine synthase activation domain-containing protein [Schaedlerella sp.]|nr:vitamin B12 dependent-methionine synthase activation domain-containing protein [Schaedlerella sp.]
MLNKKEKLIKEAVRYLGYKNHEPEGQIMKLIHEILDSVEKMEGRRFIYKIFDLKIVEDRYLKFGNIVTESKSLFKNLKNCKKVIVFAATLGIEVDRMQTRFSVMDMAKAVILQACAAAVLEAYCDECQRNIADKVMIDGYYLRPRFSPGYGDFSIEFQKSVLQMLDCGKTIGVMATDNYMLTPKKSVTAVIGMSTTEERCHHSGCEVCVNINCEFRRNIE